MARLFRAAAALVALAAPGAESNFLSMTAPVMRAKPVDVRGLVEDIREKELVEEVREKVFPPAHLFAKLRVPDHAKFVKLADGVFELEGDRALRIILGGTGKPPAKVEIATGKGAVHERFAFKDGSVRLEANPDICLGPEGSAMRDGARVRAQACERGARHQGFFLTRDSRIKATKDSLCMNVQDSLGLGAEIVLGPCGGDAGLFVHRGGLIQAKMRTDLHFNLKGGAADAPVVMWKLAPSVTEAIEWSESGQLRLKSFPDVCLVAQQGIALGSQIIGWQCSTEGEPLPNEHFGYDEARSVIYSMVDPNLVFSAKGGAMRHGAKLVLGDSNLHAVERARLAASRGAQEL